MLRDGGWATKVDLGGWNKNRRENAGMNTGAESFPPLIIIIIIIINDIYIAQIRKFSKCAVNS